MEGVGYGAFVSMETAATPRLFMRKLAIVLLASATAASAQSFPKSVQKAAAAKSSYPGTVNPNDAKLPLAARKAQLKALLAEIRQDHLEHNPEFASSIGDQRYDADLKDYSVAAYDATLDRGRRYLIQLGEIDTIGMTTQEKQSKDQMVDKLVQQQAEAESKPWEMPMTQSSGIQVELPRLVPKLKFETVKNYDDYTARLNKVPTAFAQVTNDAMDGIDDGRVPTKNTLEAILAQVNKIAVEKPENTPFAEPLSRFPTGISAAEQKRIRAEVLAAIRTKVLPAYVRMGLFLTRTYIPAAHAASGA